MANPGQPRRARVRRQNILGGFLFLVMFAGIGIFAYNYRAGSQQRVNRHSETLCPTEFEPSAYYVLLLDATDGFNDAQRDFLEQHLSAFYQLIEENARLKTFLLSGDVDEPLREISSVCNPGTGKHAKIWNANPKQLHRLWQEGFRTPREKEAEVFFGADQSPRSPIMRSIQKARRAGFPLETDKQQHIVIVSDMLEHTNEYTQYSQESLDFSSFAQTPYYRQHSTDLSDIDIRVFYAYRPGVVGQAFQRRGHREFWTEYFRAQGALQVQFDKVDG